MIDSHPEDRYNAFVKDVVETSVHIGASDDVELQASRAAGEDEWQAIDRDELRNRAARTLSASPRPFLRWAGSKRRLLPQIVDLLPERFRTYREPFLGGGALFFLLEPRQTVLSDACEPLIETFAAVRDDAEHVLAELAPLRPEKQLFYEVRMRRRERPADRAADFIYLNKSCWNGLYRVNASGQFNVPYGMPKSPALIDPANLRACSQSLTRPGIKLCSGDFEAMLADAACGDLAFLDPPYVTGHNNNGFVDYNETLFSWGDQERLARVANSLAERGVHVIVTNADHSAVRKLYDGFEIHPVTRPSTIASKASRRGEVEEVLIVAHP